MHLDGKYLILLFSLHPELMIHLYKNFSIEAQIEFCTTPVYAVLDVSMLKREQKEMLEATTITIMRNTSKKEKINYNTKSHERIKSLAIQATAYHL